MRTTFSVSCFSSHMLSMQFDRIARLAYNVSKVETLNMPETLLVMKEEKMVPHDNFTPYGYLDNPYHSWKLNPSGVLRSMEPLGMGWHVPNLGSYVHNQFQYTAHLT